MNMHVTPFLAKEDRIEIQDWNERKNEHNAFHRLIDQVGNVECKNCGDFQFLLVSFARAGPFKSVPNHRVGETLTWYGGDQFRGKGWYIVVKTRSFDCDNCGGTS